MFTFMKQSIKMSEDKIAGTWRSIAALGSKPKMDSFLIKNP
jgi:hypothetical protein